MHAETPRTTFHPVVEYHFRGQSLTAALKAYSGPREPVLEAVTAICRALNGQAPAKEALAQARKVKSFDRLDLAIIFWSSWAELDSRLDLLDEMSAVVNRMRSAVTERDPPELRAMVLIYEGLHASRLGDKVRRCELLKQAMAILPPDGFCIGAEVRCRFLAQLGMGPDADRDLDRLLTHGDAEASYVVALCRFTHYVETIQVRPALDLLPALEVDPDKVSFNRRQGHFNYFNLLSAMLDRWIPKGRYGPVPEMPFKPGWEDVEDSWLPVVDRLAARRPTEALEAARLRAREQGDHHLQGIGFDTFNLIRCELSCGNGEAARRIVEQRRGLGNRHYMDDLYLARAELLAGDRPAAARHFAALSRAVRRYRAEGRLELELRLACELSPGDVLFLERSAREPAADGLSDPAASAVVAASAGTVRPAPTGIERIVGHSPAIVAVREAVARMAPADAPVLVTGETGTGKELVARAIHELSPRAGGPFLAINCGAIAENLLESELFGHERGAFTGAARARRGIFEEAARGTVFLDEIGDVSPRLQAALLRVLESGEIRPVGANRSRRLACRVLAATNADLARRSREGAFRPDLLFRLKRLEIHIPPLAERREDVLPLAGHFLAENRRDGRRPAMSDALKAELERRDWPGNVRELRNAVERMRLMNSDKLAYELEDLGGAPAAPEARQPSARAPANIDGPLRKGTSTIRRLERLAELFREHGRLTRQEAAATLGISLPTATSDLQQLCAEGVIEKVRPSRSPRSHYFRLKGEEAPERGE